MSGCLINNIVAYPLLKLFFLVQLFATTYALPSTIRWMWHRDYEPLPLENISYLSKNFNEYKKSTLVCSVHSLPFSWLHKVEGTWAHQQYTNQHRDKEFPCGYFTHRRIINLHVMWLSSHHNLYDIYRDSCTTQSRDSYIHNI